jgi:hypothetical protein
MDNRWMWASMELHQFLVLEVQQLQSDLFTVMHNWRTYNINRQPREQHSRCPILRTSVNGGLTICRFASRWMYISIGCRHSFIRYSQCLGGKTTGLRFLPHSQNEYQESVNRFRSRILCNQDIARICAHLSHSLTALIPNNTIYQTNTTHFK